VLLPYCLPISCTFGAYSEFTPLNLYPEVELAMTTYVQNFVAEENWKVCVALILGLQLIITALIVLMVIGLGPLGA